MEDTHTNPYMDLLKFQSYQRHHFECDEKSREKQNI